MAVQDSNRRALHIVFALILGFMLVAFVGLGVRALYPLPNHSGAELQKLNDQQKALDSAGKLAGGMSRSHEAFYKNLLAKIAAEKQVVQAGQGTWARNTSIILIALATLMLGVSLVVAERLPTFSDGLLMGGLFTMIYGTAWYFTRDASSTRFAVLAVALVVTLAVGYLRFVRARKVGEGAPSPLEPTPLAG